MDQIKAIYANYGHGCSGGPFGYHVHQYIPENTLEAIELCIKKVDEGSAIWSHERFLYLEFDIRETADHNIMVFHDDRLFRRVMDAADPHNVAALVVIQKEMEKISRCQGFKNK